MGARRLERPGALDLEAATGLRLVLPGRRVDLEPRRQPKVNQVDLGRLFSQTQVVGRTTCNKHTTRHSDAHVRADAHREVQRLDVVVQHAPSMHPLEPSQQLFRQHERRF